MKIISLLGRGGFGRVERVRLRNGEEVARKVFDPEPGIPKDLRPHLLDRFSREVRSQSTLADKYPGKFLPVLDSDETKDEPWFTMPLADRSFVQIIKSSRREDDLPFDALSEILDALEAMHGEGYVHRDLKPDNILFYDEKWQLGDFGLVLSTRTGTTVLTHTGMRAGSYDYMSPEQHTNFHHVTNTADIYSFGCILHDLVVGTSRAPFGHYTCDGPLRTILERCTEIDPTQRYPDVRILRKRLQAVVRPRVRALAPGKQRRTNWAERLENVETWDDEDIRKCLEDIKDDDDYETEVFEAWTPEKIKELYSIDQRQWQYLALEFCAWAHRGFEFGFCDSIADRLEIIFDRNNDLLKLRSAVAIALAFIGHSHNRWYVMETLVNLCDEDLDDNTAEQIATDIEITKAERDFIGSVSAIGKDIDAYHPFIADILRD